jgi:hypothetical protein
MPMSRCLLAGFVAAMGLLALQVPASAETLRCRSVNGNLTCAGSGGVSCQTVDGHKVCVSGGGDVVQEFGGGDPGESPSVRVERRFPHSMLLERDGTRLHFRNDWISIDRE